MAYAGQYRTTQDLFAETLANLGVLSSGQPVDPEDLLYVTTKYDAVLRELDGLEIVHLSSFDTAAIPGAWFSSLADILAGECCSKFGYTGQDRAEMVNKGLGGGTPDVEPGQGTAALKLKIMGRLKPTGEPTRVEYM